MPPLVSVIIPVYNGQRHIRAALDSALAQTFGPIEILVIDDGSTEPIAPMLADYGDRIRLFRHPNAGVAATRNRGIREARGEIIALLDQDDLWLPDKLEREVALLLSDEEIGFVHGDVIYRDDTQGRDYTKFRPRAENSGRCYERLFQACAISACTVIVRRRVLEEIGLFDETIKGTDDYDLALRISRRYILGYVDAPVAIYRVHENNWSHRSLDMLRNELRVVRKALDADKMLPSLVGADVVTRRLVDLLNGIGYTLYTAGKYAEARPYFREALGLVSDPVTFARWISTWLPTSVVSTLRHAKQSRSAA